MGKGIYLAGKIAPGDWRHEVVSGLRRAGTGDADAPWPVLCSAVLGRYDYVGPFFISCDHSGLHGPNSHGVGANQDEGDEECCGLASLGQADVVRRCMQAIARADLFYAWLDDMTAFGTLAEIGFASGNRGGSIVVATPTDYEHERDLWFSLHLPGVHHVRAANAIAGLRAGLAVLGWS